ncbi:Thoeris anti-defense Tad2 family protein [Xenorhabdus thuongxuanensis]
MMSENKQCPFNPDQYQNKDVVVPFGSFPWAIVQVYLGKKVYRSNWNFPVEYIRLAGVPDDSPYIEKYNSGNSTHWQSTQEDMLACDWDLMDCMLSFDLTSGTETSSHFGNVGWGYISDKLVGWPHTMGALNITSNNEIDITEISSFSWGEISNTFYINSSTKQDKGSYQKVGFLFQNKELRVVVNNESYNLGKAQLGHHEGDGPYDYEFSYQNAEAQRLGVLLQQMQKTGQPQNFCLHWVGK